MAYLRCHWHRHFFVSRRSIGASNTWTLQGSVVSARRQADTPACSAILGWTSSVSNAPTRPRDLPGQKNAEAATF